VTDLNDEIGAGCNWELREALDVNSSEWIVGSGIRSIGGVNEIRAFLLYPNRDCPADLDEDGEVDVEDLLLLLQAWGTCPIGSLCIESVVCPDQTVDTQDLLALLGSWGDCTGTAEDIPQTVEDCLDAFDPGTLELEKCLEAVGGE